MVAAVRGAALASNEAPPTKEGRLLVESGTALVRADKAMRNTPEYACRLRQVLDWWEEWGRRTAKRWWPCGWKVPVSSDGHAVRAG